MVSKFNPNPIKIIPKVIGFSDRSEVNDQDETDIINESTIHRQVHP
jgi:hypothetical protein